MPEVGVGTVPIHPDFSGFGSRLSGGIMPAVDRTTSNVTSRFTGMFRGIATAGAGMIAAVGIKRFVGGVIEEAREAQKVARETAQRVEKTGASAWTSAGQVESLAGRLSELVAVDDEVIQSGANLLLTFKGVRNEVGKGNNIFDRATGLALDMSSAFKTDLRSATMQLGKALENPIKGVTALTRSGVSFTEQQKEQIRTLVESGRTLDAQKIILGEVEAQVGGTAAAVADPWQRFGVVVGNIKERIGLALLPALNAAGTWLSDKLPGAIDTAGRWFGTLKAGIDSFLYTFRTGFFEDEGTPLERFALKVRAAAKWVTGTLVPALRDFGRFLTEKVWPVVQRGVELLGGWKPVLIAAGIAVAAIVSPLGTLAAGAIYAYTEFEGFRRVVDGVAKFLRDDVAPQVKAFAGYLAEQFGNLADWTREHWASIQEAVGHVVVAVQTVVRLFVSYVRMLWRQWGDEITNITKLVWDQIRLYVETAINLVRGVIEVVVALINGDWGKAWDAFKGILSTAWDFIVDYVGNALRIVGQVIEGALSSLRTVWDAAWDGLKAIVFVVWEWIKGQISDAIGTVSSTITGSLDAIRGAWESAWGGIGSFFSGVWNGIKQAAVDGVNWVIVHVIDPFIATLQKLIDLYNSIKILPDLNVRLDPLGPIATPDPYANITPLDIDARRELSASAASVTIDQQGGKAGGGFHVEHLEVHADGLKEPAAVVDMMDRKLGWRAALAGRGA